MAKKQAPLPSTDLALHLSCGADEMNVAEFPLAWLGERPGDVKTLEFSDTVFDRGAGKTVTRKLTIAGSDKYGLPCAGDEDVLVALLYLTKAAGFQNRTVHFSRYQLIKLLGWADSGQSYERLDDALNRWVSVTLIYENAWWNKRVKAWENPKLHILSNVNVLKGGKRPQAELPLSSITWDETIFASFVAKNTKNLDLERYFRLTLAPARRMYRFLDKRFGAGTMDTWQFELRKFACEHIGFSRNYDSAQLKRKMRPSIEQLEADGFIEPRPEAERYGKGQRRGEWTVTFEPRREELTPAEPASLPPAVSPLEQELIGRGVTASTAAELIAAHPAETIAGHVEVLDWLVESNDKRAAKNPAGYLVTSIREGYQPPKGFEPKAERLRKQLTAAEAERQKKEKTALARRQQQEHDERVKAERDHVVKLLAGFSEVERAAAEAEALAAASPENRELATAGLFNDTMRRMILNQYLLKRYPLPAPPAG